MGVKKDAEIPAGEFAGQKLSTLNFMEAERLLVEIGDTGDVWYRAAKIQRKNAARHLLKNIRDQIDIYAGETLSSCPNPSPIFVSSTTTNPTSVEPAPKPKKSGVARPRANMNMKRQKQEEDLFG